MSDKMVWIVQVCLQWSRVASPALCLGVVVCLAAVDEPVTAQGVLAGAAAETARPASPERESMGLQPRTVAVFPFANISGLPGDDWIGTGIAATVTVDLAQVEELSVVTGDLGIVNDDTRARDLARALGVSWIVSGSFQHLGDQLRITARIVHVETGTSQGTVTVDGRLDEVFVLQDRVVADLADEFAGIAGMTAARPDRPPRNTSSARPGVFAGNGSGSGNFEAPAATVSGGITLGDRPAGFAAAAVAGEAGALAGRVTVRPVRTATPPNIDGRLDDAVWQDAMRITEFVQEQPLDGAPASEETEVFLAYDNANIYLGFHAKYQDPGILRANRMDRDRAGFFDDTFSVYFDTFLDQQRAYVFSVNGYGVQGDSIVGGTGGGGFGGGVVVVVVGAAVAAGRLALDEAPFRAATDPGTRCTARAGNPSRTASQPRWPFRSRAFATRRVDATCRTRGGSRSSARSRARTRPSSGPRSRATSRAFCPKWVSLMA